MGAVQRTPFPVVGFDHELKSQPTGMRHRLMAPSSSAGLPIWPIDWQRVALQVSASVGIALFPGHAEDAEALRRLADAAMSAVKNSGQNNYAFARDASSLARRA